LRGILAEVAGLVEYPVVLMGQIGEDCLWSATPGGKVAANLHERAPEVLFRGNPGRPIERFVTFANRTTAVMARPFWRETKNAVGVVGRQILRGENDHAHRAIRMPGMRHGWTGLSNGDLHN